jgi:hypothetical protein
VKTLFPILAPAHAPRQNNVTSEATITSALAKMLEPRSAIGSSGTIAPSNTKSAIVAAYA